MYFLRRAPYEGLARMRERGSRVTLVTRAMYIRTYVCTIKCGINTHDRVDGSGGGGSLRRETEIDNAPRWVTLGKRLPTAGGVGEARGRVETTREPTEVCEFVPNMCARVCVCTRVHVGCIVDILSLHTPAQPAHYVYRAPPAAFPSPSPFPFSPAVPCAAPRAFPHPSLSTALEIHLVVRLAPVSSRLTSSRSFLFLAPCRNSSSPRRSRSRYNERCTLLSSCSRRRCFHSAAQSVSARLPARFARRFAPARRTSGLTRNEPKPTWREIEEPNLSRLFIILSIAML